MDKIGVANCRYSIPKIRYSCPFDAEEGEEYCIFHLPKEKKEPKEFWKHLASYLIALMENTDKKKIKDFLNRGEAWIFQEKDDVLIGYYKSKIEKGKRWEFTGFIFPEMDGEHNFNNFPLWDADFERAQFSGNADFSGTQFSGYADFSGAQFSGYAGFIRTKFSGYAGFSEAQFSGYAVFSEAQFSGDADFSGAEFSGYAGFIRTKFSGYAGFSGTQFSGNAYFSLARFSGNADFSKSQFFGNADFSEARFSGNAGFSFAQFSGNADFRWTEFSGYANFSWAQFSGNADFRWTEFSGYANFSWAQFSGIADFREAQLLGNAYFIESQFSGNADFAFARFLKKTDFRSSRVNLLDFTSCEIFSFLRLREIQQIKGSSDPPIILLRDLRFWENGHILLEDFVPSGISFLHTNFHIVHPRIYFIRMDWGKEKIILDDIFKRKEYREIKAEKEKKREMKEEKRSKWEIVYDPIEEMSEEKKVEEIERCYRQIRLAYEAMGEYPDAGDFYLQEMRVRKIRFKGFNLTYILYLFYGIVSNYGESYSQALGCLGIIFLLSYIILALRSIFFGLSFDFGKAVEFSFHSIIPTPTSPQNIPFLIILIKWIFGVPVLTLFLLAIRRRFKR